MARRPIRRVPLPGSRVPFRVEDDGEASPELFGFGAESDRALQKKLVAQMQKRPPPQPSTTPPPTGPPAAGDALNSLVLGRLTALEEENRSLKQQLSGKDGLIVALKRKVAALQAAIPSQSTQDLIAHLQDENAKQRKDLHEIETFLNDYGLVWVGGSEDSSSSLPSSGRTAASGTELDSTHHNDDDSNDDLGSIHDGDLEASPLPRKSEQVKRMGGSPITLASLPTSTSSGDGGGGPSSSHTKGPGLIATFEVDGELLEQRVNELNVLAGDGLSDVVVGPSGSTGLKARRALVLSVWRNGFTAAEEGESGGAAFRSFSTPDGEAFLRDILDGYFPYELKDRYPDGIPILLIPHLREDFVAPAHFPGVGVTLSGVQVAASSSSSSSGDRVSTEEYLTRLPERVIRNGNVVEVRASIAAKLQGSPGGERPDVVIVQTELVKMISAQSSGRPSTPHDVTTLQIRSPDGEPTLIVKLRFKDSVGLLRQYVTDERNKLGAVGGFALRTAYPPRAYSDDSETLEAAGLVPNGILILQREP